MAQKPDHMALGRRMMTSSIVMFVLVTGAAVLISTGILDIDPPVALDVRLEQSVPWRAGEPLTITAWPVLTNNQDEAMALTAPNRCDVFRWVLLRPDETFVQAENEQGCSDVKVETWLPPKTAQSDTYQLQLDSGRVTPGEYRLAVRYWGEEKLLPLMVE